MGITTLQMDIKIEGITEEIMEVALNQARGGRLHILNAMNQVIVNALSRSEHSCTNLYNFTNQSRKNS